MTVIYGPEDALYGTGRYGVARYGSVGPTKLVSGVSFDTDIGTLKINLTLKPQGYPVVISLGSAETSGEANKALQGTPATLVLGTATSSGKASYEVSGYLLDQHLGNATIVAKANKTLLGNTLLLVLGDTIVRSINKVEVSGLPATLSLGDLTAEGGTGYTLNVDGYEISSNLGTIKPNLKTFVTGVSSVVNLNTVKTSGKATVFTTANSLTFQEGSVTPVAVIVDFNQFTDDYSGKRTAYVVR